MKYLIILLILFCAACMPMLATGDDELPLAPADEVWLHGYTRGIHDACVNASIAIVKEQTGAVSRDDMHSIVKSCEKLADGVQERGRAKMYDEEHYKPTPTPPALPKSKQL